MSDMLTGLPAWLAFIIISVAAYRITRFFTFDSLMGFNLTSDSKISVRVDRFAYDEDGSDRSWWRGKIGDLLGCPFCLGAHISWILVCLWFRVWPWELGVDGWIYAFAVMGVQAFLSSRSNA